jgi:hypothetical protein
MHGQPSSKGVSRETSDSKALLAGAACRHLRIYHCECKRALPGRGVSVREKPEPMLRPLALTGILAAHRGRDAFLIVCERSLLVCERGRVEAT